MRPITTKQSTFTFDVLRASGPVLVDFYADWCGQCRRLAPVLDELATVLDGQVTIAKVDVTRNEHLADRYGIEKIPTLILFDHGEEKGRLVEATHRSTVEAFLQTTTTSDAA